MRFLDVKVVGHMNAGVTGYLGLRHEHQGNYVEIPYLNPWFLMVSKGVFNLRGKGLVVG